MKKIFITATLFLTFNAAAAFAQMGHGMMRELPAGTMHEHMMGHAGMMSHEQMRGNMRDMMNRMSGLMENMSGMMKDLPADKMKRISGMMIDMCTEMNRMSEMMDKGMTTDDEMKAMHDRMMEMQKQMSDLEK